MRGKPKLIQLRDKSGKLKSNYWYIYFTDGNSDKRISTGYRIGKEDTEAQIALAQFILERKHPTAREPGQLMIVQALKDYWDEHAQYSIASDRAEYCEKRVLKFFGALFVSQIIPAKVNEYVRECQGKQESNGTIRRDLEHLRAAINHEVNNGRILYAPKFKLPDAPPPKERVLTEGEVNLILSHCKSKHVHNSIVLMFNTGQRPGAIANLTWFQVDFEKWVIRFDKTGKQQTNKRMRPVAMNQATYELLAELHAERRTGHVIEYVIRNKAGDIITAKPAGNIKKAFARACAAAGLTGVSRYTLRHTFANTLVADEKTRSDIMGHTTTETTQHHYIKTNHEKQRTVLDSLPRLRKFSATTKNGKV